MNDLNDRIIALQKAFAEFMKQAKTEFPSVMQAYINENMHTQPANPAAFNTTGKLYTRKGALVRSFIPGQKGNIFNVKNADENGLVMEFGTNLPYATIQEYGGFIKATPKMIGYFWAMHKQTQLKFFKILALAARKNGGVRIKARPYFDPAVKKYEKEGIVFLQRNLFTSLEKAWNGK
jgi:phage gpG-like protein